MHDRQLAVSGETASALIAAQFPETAAMAVKPLNSSGTVNSIFRVGDGLVARFPLRSSSPEETRQHLETEAAAVSEFAGHCPYPAPTWIGVGEPGPGYPAPWSLQTWVDGTPADQLDASGSVELGVALARLIQALRNTDTRGRSFAGQGRGGDLRSHDAWVEQCLVQSEGMLDVPRLRELWARLRDLPRRDRDVMSHRDLIPGNVLVDGGSLVGVIDTGSFGPADPALDVIAAWHLLDDQPREAFRALLECDELEWERSKAWAFEQAIGLVWYYAASNPVMSQVGRTTLQRIIGAQR